MFIMFIYSNLFILYFAQNSLDLTWCQEVAHGYELERQLEHVAPRLFLFKCLRHVHLYLGRNHVLPLSFHLGRSTIAYSTNTCMYIYLHTVNM